MKNLHEKLASLVRAFEDEVLRAEVEISLPGTQLASLFQDVEMRALFASHPDGSDDGRGDGRPRKRLFGMLRISGTTIKFYEKEGA